MSSINDRNDWKVVRKALSVIGFNVDEVEVRSPGPENPARALILILHSSSSSSNSYSSLQVSFSSSVSISVCMYVCVIIQSELVCAERGSLPACP